MKKLTLALFRRNILCLCSFSFISILSSAQTITTVAGSANYGYGGDGGPATSADLANPIGVVTDRSGNLYIGDYANNRVRMVNPAGIISTLAGKGLAKDSGDGGPASSAEIDGPGGLAVDSAGNVYITELEGSRISKVDVSTGIITTIAGNGTLNFNGDGGPATSASLSYPTGICFDKKGNLYIADDINNRVRMVNTTGIINTIAGNGTGSYSGDGGPATAAELSAPTGVVVDDSGRLYIGDQVNARIRIVDTSGTINTFAGNGATGFAGNGGPATAAELDHPEEIALDAAGNLYIDDEGNDAIRVVTTAGTIRRFAGIGLAAGFYGDGGPATAAELSGPQGVYIDLVTGNMYIGDYGNSRVREVTNISTAINSKLTEDNSQLTIYPNPAKQQINILLDYINSEFTIILYNIQGKEITKQSFSNQQLAVLSTSSIPGGLYLLKIEMADGSVLIRKVEIIP